jgi:hypothetical protein
MKVPDLVCGETNEREIEFVDLTKYAFRQKVQELLFKSKQDYLDTILYKRELKEAFRVIRKYMRVHHLHDDSLLQLLCDDISVTYRTVGSRDGNMYAISRYTSQGRQKSYNVKSKLGQSSCGSQGERQGSCGRKALVDPDHFRNATHTPKRMSRAPVELEDELNETQFIDYEKKGFFAPPANVFKNIYDEHDYAFEDEIDEYVPSDNDTTCFATPEILNTMRSMSHSPGP